MSIWDDNEHPIIAAEREELRKLRAEIERLTVEREKKQTEIERLRGALSSIDALATGHKKGAIGLAQKLARRALERK
jgi:predicted  nucleic acid-binding Zn-ribbon protein